MLFHYFCKLTIWVKQDKQNVANFWKTSIRILFARKTKAKLVNKENISVVEITIT